MSSGMKKSASSPKDAKPNLDFLTSRLQSMGSLYDLSYEHMHTCHCFASS